MASANFDALHLRLSRRIQDAVAAAATDGVLVTSSQRTDYLNRASVWIQHVGIRLGEPFVSRFLSGLKSSQAVTWSSSGYTLPTDIQTFLEAVSTGATTVYLKWHPSKAELDSGTNSKMPNAFTVLGGKTYGYVAGAILTSGSGTLYYLANDKRASSGDSSDIQIDPIWYDVLVELAASFVMEDRGELDRAQALMNSALNIFKFSTGTQTGLIQAPQE